MTCCTVVRRVVFQFIKMMLLTSILLCLSFTAISSDPLRSIFRTDIRVEEHNVANGPQVTIPAIDLPNYLGRWYTVSYVKAIGVCLDAV